MKSLMTLNFLILVLALNGCSSPQSPLSTASANSPPHQNSSLSLKKIPVQNPSPIVNLPTVIVHPSLDEIKAAGRL